jgi:hypothetical protein
MSYSYLLTTVAVLGLTFGIANAGPVPITNASFECDLLATPTSPNPTVNNLGFGPGCVGNPGGNPGWAKTEPFGDSVGTWRPLHGGQQSTSANISYTQYPDLTSAILPAGFTGATYANGVPDGFNYGYISYGLIHQVLTTSIQGGTTYTLRAYVGTRWDYDSVNVGFDQYTGVQQL